MSYFYILFLIFIILLLYLLINIIILNYCKLGFNNKYLTLDKVNELNKSKFYSIKGDKNEKSLISKINNYLE